RRTAPTWLSAAAVCPEESVAPMYTPWFHDSASLTSGTVSARRPPNRMAEIGTPAGELNSGAATGHRAIGVQYRELGWAACPARPSPAGVHSLPSQSTRCSGVFSRPSHHTSWSSVRATLVKMELPGSSVFMALGLEE